MLFEYHSLAQYGIGDVLLTLAALLSGNGAKEEIIKELLVGSRLLLNNAERKLSSYWMCLVTFFRSPFSASAYDDDKNLYIHSLRARRLSRCELRERGYIMKNIGALFGPVEECERHTTPAITSRDVLFNQSHGGSLALAHLTQRVKNRFLRNCTAFFTPKEDCPVDRAQVKD